MSVSNAKADKKSPVEIDAQLYLDAQKGLLSRTKVLVDSAEIARLIKSGFEVLCKESAEDQRSKDLYYVTISWEHAYADGLPEEIYIYVYSPGENTVCPETPNYAAYLYAKALRHAVLSRH